MPLIYGYAAELFGLSARAVTPDVIAELPEELPEELPVLLMSGQHDPVGGTEASQVSALAHLLCRRGLPVDQHVYPGARHEIFKRDEPARGDRRPALPARQRLAGAAS